MSRILPILFNTNMVLKILDDKKTVTRRVIKFPKNKFTGKIPIPDDIKVYEKTLMSEKVCFSEKPYYSLDAKPPCYLGDILYVRETWNEWTDGYVYKAWNKPFPQPGYYPGMTWHPSIHMPKEAARIWLKVTNIRAERLQDITESGAIKEGFENDIEYALGNPAVYYFIKLWDQTINKKNVDLYSWKANPWVWVIEFERCEKPKE